MVTWATAFAAMFALAVFLVRERQPEAVHPPVPRTVELAVVQSQADYDGFIPLPNTAGVAADEDDVNLVRVEVPRSAMIALGLDVSADRAGGTGGGRRHARLQRRGARRAFSGLIGLAVRGGITMRMTIVALIALAAGAFAQGPPPGRGGRGRMGFDGLPVPAGRIESGAGMLRAGVKNAPFSADVVTESTHTLADGNHIRQTVTSKVYRDSEGRTRREQAVNLNGLAPNANMPQMVFINDPVAGVSYSLNAKDRTGTKYVRNGRGSSACRRMRPAGSESSRRRPGGSCMGRRNAAPIRT